VGALYATGEGVPYRLTEITSSGINRFFARAGDLPGNRLGAVYGRENFGTLDIDWWSGTVTLAVRGMNGEKVREATLRLADLHEAGG
jgi:hypothetical protein